MYSYPVIQEHRGNLEANTVLEVHYDNLTMSADVGGGVRFLHRGPDRLRKCRLSIYGVVIVLVIPS